ncbi:MAG: hemerythrin domain-containing protein [Chitinophagaceae bacterium]|jgi:hemerythrin-like domain-containing protein
MKRNKNLQPLSRQHHNALMAVLLLRKGVQKNVDANVMKDFILSVWNDELKTHFKAEEKWMIPNVEDEELHIMYKQILNEHQQLRAFIRQFEINISTIEIIEQFYKLLDQHIRFEERIFFPAVEKNFTTTQLETIGKHIKDTRTESCASFPVKFWE